MSMSVRSATSMLTESAVSMLEGSTVSMFATNADMQSYAARLQKENKKRRVEI